MDKIDFIKSNTTISAPPHVPEIRLHLADEAHELWHKTEEELQEIGLPPPFWAFAWAGGQGLARYVLDHKKMVKNRKVLDFASGSGLVAIAAKIAGARSVIANDIDPFCETAIALNAALNGQTISHSNENLLEQSLPSFDQFDVLLAGDVFYDKQMADRLWPFLQKVAKTGKTVLIGDPGRSYFPKSGVKCLAEYQVPVTRVLEDSEVKRTQVWELTL